MLLKGGMDNSARVVRVAFEELLWKTVMKIFPKGHLPATLHTSINMGTTKVSEKKVSSQLCFQASKFIHHYCRMYEGITGIGK